MIIQIVQNPSLDSEQKDIQNIEYMLALIIHIVKLLKDNLMLYKLIKLYGMVQ